MRAASGLHEAWHTVAVLSLASSCSSTSMPFLATSGSPALATAARRVHAARRTSSHLSVASCGSTSIAFAFTWRLPASARAASLSIPALLTSAGFAYLATSDGSAPDEAPLATSNNSFHASPDTSGPPATARAASCVHATPQTFLSLASCWSTFIALPTTWGPPAKPRAASCSHAAQRTSTFSSLDRSGSSSIVCLSTSGLPVKASLTSCLHAA
mmetsp:Transcript_75765/g.204890  ORF Transcript_75765/g.204890 Transcript_75765/m.204890 type:complete len:214 (-) Transcript_75765:404-1045(-)